MTSVVDASIWVAVILDTDIHHIVSTQWAQRIRRRQSELIVPAHFPAEVAGVVSRIGLKAELADAVIAEIVDGEELFHIQAIDRDFARFSAQVAAHSAIRGADAVYVALAAMLDLPLVTWDRQQPERGALFCRTMTPVEAMEMNA